MAYEAIVYCEVNPMPTIPDAVGSGGQIPVVIDITTPGTTSFSTLNLPAETLITVELWGPGGGGAGSPVGASPGGGGGGGGSYACVTFTSADLVFNDAQIVVGAAGTGGAANTNGTDGGETRITDDGDPWVVAAGGMHGVAVAGVGGTGGVATNEGTATVVELKNGTAGTTASTAAGGSGGGGAGQGYSAGGAGGTGTSGAGAAATLVGGGGGGGAATVGIGGAGFKGRARFSFPIGG